MKILKIQYYDNFLDVIIDDEDFEKISKYSWSISKVKNTYYAVHGQGKNRLKMHRVILDVTNPKIEIDHINSIGWDNRRNNLRLVTHHQNMFNKRLASNNTSGYKGVSWDKTRNLWKSRIKINGVYKNLGRFICKKEAAKAYNTKALELFGSYAKLNVIN